MATTSPPRCDGDGYTERWNDDQTGIVIELCEGCPDCDGPKPLCSCGWPDFSDCQGGGFTCPANPSGAA